VPEPLPEDPLRLRSRTAFVSFSLYLRWYLHRNFNAVRVSRSGFPPDPIGRPLIICSNHPSWWDPAMFIVLSRALLRGRIGFGPMDAAALARYRFMRRVGVFGIEPGRRGAARFLRDGVRILSHPQAALWITAEGAFTDPRTRPLRLRPGIAHLARRVPHAVIVPLALEYPFWNERFPEALVRFGPPVVLNPADGIEEVTEALQAALAETMDALAAESIARDPGGFQLVLSGRAGVGGVYDLWRRGVALSQGQRFDPHHEPGA
jgi:1-acyl-sn-glycerol-3-phosphate acyltransferase